MFSLFKNGTIFLIFLSTAQTGEESDRCSVLPTGFPQAFFCFFFCGRAGGKIERKSNAADNAPTKELIQ